MMKINFVIAFGKETVVCDPACGGHNVTETRLLIHKDDVTKIHKWYLSDKCEDGLPRVEFNHPTTVVEVELHQHFPTDDEYATYRQIGLREWDTTRDWTEDVINDDIDTSDWRTCCENIRQFNNRVDSVEYIVNALLEDGWVELTREMLEEA